MLRVVVAVAKMFGGETGKKYRWVAAIVLLAIHPYQALEAQELFSVSEDCAFCHTSSPGVLVDSQGNDLSIFHDWGSTMMANSFRDPIFRAKLESEQKRNPHLSSLIEDKCLSCHTPMAHTQHFRNGGDRYPVELAKKSELALDGVSCTLCHQIQAAGLGTGASFSGHYTIDDSREIYGPYRDVFANPMVHQVGYRPLYGAQVHESALCGTCHTLFTPTVDKSGKVVGDFPEQTPYLEWLNSTYASADAGRSCQDCHMPRIDEAIKITNRPPWLENRQTPFWQHHFTGGNTFVLEMMRSHPELSDLTASDEDFRLTIGRTRQRLTEETAGLSMETEISEPNKLQLKVTVKNRTGHKFPSGFPVRRAWLQVQVDNSSGIRIFDSGSWDDRGEISGLDQSFEPHHDLIRTADQVQIYQAVMKDIDNNPTFTLLRAAGYLKDNRLVPHGYEKAGPMTEYTGITGKAAVDDNFNREEGKEGTGTDRVTYEVEIEDNDLPLEITVRLLYQTVPPQFINDLLADNTAATRRLAAMYEQMNSQPVVIATRSQVVKKDRTVSLKDKQY